jgi:HSP20 family molecular chaperone IbpA
MTFVTEVGDAVLRRAGRVAGRLRRAVDRPVDVLESETAYLLVFDVPGASTSDVVVSYRDDAVEVRVDRFRAFHEGFEMRFPGRELVLDARAELPADAAVDPERAEATLRDDGTLQVTLPKCDPEEDEHDDVDVDSGAA